MNGSNRNIPVPDVPDFFARTFPGLRQALDDFEANFHGTARRIRLQMIQPPFTECIGAGAVSLSRPGSSKNFCRPGSRSALDVRVPHYELGPMMEINLHDQAMDVLVDDGVAGFENHHDSEAAPPAKVNLTGKFKHIHNLNYDAFLKSQNIPMLSRKAANASSPIYIYTHNNNNNNTTIDFYCTQVYPSP